LFCKFDNFLSAHVQTHSSHLEDELLIVLGFLSFKGFPVKNLCSILWMSVFTAATISVLSSLQSANFYEVVTAIKFHAHVKFQQVLGFRRKP